MADGERLVSLVERVLQVKALPVFADASLDEAAVIAEHIGERHFHAGEALFRAGEFADSFYFVVEGKVRVERGGAAAPSPYPPGALDALEQRPHDASCIAEGAVHAFQLRAHDLFDVLEDFFDLSRALLGELARHCVRLEREVGAPPPVAGAPLLADAPLDLLQKIVVLKGVPLLAGASIDELARLAGEVTEARGEPGRALYRAGEPADAFHVLLRGRVAGHGPRTAIGALDVIAQDSRAREALVEEPAHFLRVPAEAYFDLLEDHFDIVGWTIRDLGGRIRRLAGARRAAHA